MKVLIADDDPLWRKLLEQNVRKWEYEVVTAQDGQQAWQILQEKGAPRVALLDWQMPKLDGIEVCRRIRESLNLPLIYTIILTSRDTRDDRIIGLESGADDYLVKPVDMAILRTRLTAAVRIVKAVPPPRQIPGYKLLGRLGAGAMATVYKARQLSLDRLVAVKVLPKKSSQTPRFVERFYAEGRAAAKLNHPNIVAALDVGRHGDTHYFVMEYVEGHTVSERLVKEGSYSEAEALDIGTQIATALDHAHQAGLMHRDVKPKNILITQERVAKLADMGLARSLSDREAAEAGGQGLRHALLHLTGTDSRRRQCGLPDGYLQLRSEALPPGHRQGAFCRSGAVRDHAETSPRASALAPSHQTRVDRRPLQDH